VIRRLVVSALQTILDSNVTSVTRYCNVVTLFSNVTVTSLLLLYQFVIGPVKYGKLGGPNSSNPPLPPIPKEKEIGKNSRKYLFLWRNVEVLDEYEDRRYTVAASVPTSRWFFSDHCFERRIGSLLVLTRRYLA